MLKERIDEFYNIKEEEKERTHFYVSETDNCPRAVFYSFKSMPKAKLDPIVQRKMEHGTFTHIRLMSALFGLGVVRATEIKIPEDQLFKGRADAIVTMGGEIYVLEIKSMNNGFFKNLNQPNKAQNRQIQLYMHYFNIDKGIVLVENKDTQELKEFIVLKNEEEIAKVFSEFEELKSKIKNNEVPNKPFDLEEWKCRYCPYEFCEFFLGKNK